MIRFAACSVLLAFAIGACAQDGEAKITVGKPAPDFEVTGVDGKAFKLSDKTKAGKHVAIMFSRAHW